MNEVDFAREGFSRIVDIRSGEPFSVRLPIGAVVYAIRGQVWITQEGLYDDVILEAGERFAIERKGLVVIGATSPTAVTYLAASHSGHALGRIPAAFFEAVAKRAAELRRRELSRLLSRAWARVRAVLPGPNAPRPRGR